MGVQWLWNFCAGLFYTRLAVQQCLQDDTGGYRRMEFRSLFWASLAKPFAPPDQNFSLVQTTVQPTGSLPMNPVNRRVR